MQLSVSCLHLPVQEMSKASHLPPSLDLLRSSGGAFKIFQLLHVRKMLCFVPLMSPAPSRDVPHHGEGSSLMVQLSPIPEAQRCS